MWRFAAVWAVALAASIGGCSRAPRLSPTPDLDPELVTPPAPQVFATGTVSWGLSPDQRFTWELEGVPGYPDAVTLTATAEAQISVRSATPTNAEDPVWLIGIVFGDGAPPLVFGGADQDIDRVVLVTSEGEELPLELAELPDRSWALAIQELPRQWAELVGGGAGIEVVALRDGVEIARELVEGLN